MAGHVDPVKSNHGCNSGGALILTQALGHNYGGILQAYALQRVIKQMGVRAVTNHPIRVRNPLKRILGRARSRISNQIDTREVREIEAELRRFVSENIDTIDLFRGKGAPTPYKMRQFDAFVVGSDQVWRAAFSDVRKHLLNFVENSTATKISYAASFGTGELTDYTPSLISDSARLAKKFDAISVREESAVEICRRYWGVDAKHLVDPTLLLTKSDWGHVIEKDGASDCPSPGNLLVYVLDQNVTASRITDAVAAGLGLKAFSAQSYPTVTRSEYYRNPSRYKMASVAQWLQGFSQAEYVVTDSFHGCVFSIIFNKPFVAIGNSERGLARQTSLLKLFGLEERLVYRCEEVSSRLLEGCIDWDSVNAVILKERERALDFLNTHLAANRLGRDDGLASRRAQ